MNSINPEIFVKNAKSLIGVTWSHAGRSRETGIDCTGLVVVSMNMSGGNLPLTVDYHGQDQFARLVRESESYFDQVSENWKDAKIGDILVFRGKNMHNHVGIYTGEGTFIHAINEGPLCVVETPFKGDWRVKLKTICRYKNFEVIN